jgi:hypothetical protein
MHTELPANYTEAELLYHFLGERISDTRRDISLQELLTDFLQYRRELRDLRDKIRAAELSSAAGKSQELDVEDLIAEVTRQLTAEGIGE